MNAIGSMTPKEIADALGEKGVNIRNLLTKMIKDGESISSPTRGKYEYNDFISQKMAGRL